MKILLMVLFIDALGNETYIKHSEYKSAFDCHIAKAHTQDNENVKYSCVNSNLVKKG